MADIEVANVVGQIIYQQELDLAELADTFSNHDNVLSVTYDPSENHWLQTRFGPDDSYVAFYRSGKCSIAGGESIDHFYDIAERVNDVMSELLEFGYQPEVEISNIVATTDLGSSLPLEALTLELGMERTEYEPEQFPALMYRNSDSVILIFSSGKLLCTGLTDLDAVDEAIEDISSKILTVV